MRRITIKREKGYYAKIRKLKITVDDRAVATLKQGELVEIELPDNAQLLRGKMDWGKTNSVSLQEVKDGDTFTFKAYFTLNPFKNLGIINMPIKLTAE